MCVCVCVCECVVKLVIIVLWSWNIAAKQIVTIEWLATCASNFMFLLCVLLNAFIGRNEAVNVISILNWLLYALVCVCVPRIWMCSDVTTCKWLIFVLRRLLLSRATWEHFSLIVCSPLRQRLTIDLWNNCRWTLNNGPFRQTDCSHCRYITLLFNIASMSWRWMPFSHHELSPASPFTIALTIIIIYRLQSNRYHLSIGQHLSEQMQITI